MRENIAAAMKQALKDKDQAALGTMRLIMAALKDRDIAARGNGNPDGITNTLLKLFIGYIFCCRHFVHRYP